MRFLIDHDVFEVTCRFIKKLGHDVIKVSEIGHSNSPDIELLHLAKKKKRVFITRDRDFGALVFIKKIISGVIYIRIKPTTVNSCHNQLSAVLNMYSELELKSSFLVIEPGRHRYRKIV